MRSILGDPAVRCAHPARPPVSRLAPPRHDRCQDAPLHPDLVRRRRRRARRRARSAGSARRERRAEVLLRPARLASLRGHHRAARVLPDADRGGDLRGARRGDGGRDRCRRRARRSRRRQLRQGGQPVPAARAEPLCRDRHLGRLPARRAAPASARSPAGGHHRPRPGLLGPPRPSRGPARRRPAGVLLSGLEHRQLHARRRPCLSRSACASAPAAAAF